MTTAAKPSPPVILLAEDDVGDQILTQEAFGVLKLPHELRIVSDGQEALEYLYHKGAYQQADKAPRPDLILLDLNMPRVNGQQVAAVVHADASLRDIPIVVLTISRREEDVVRAYSHGVTGYLGKALDFQHFVNAVRELEGLIKFVARFKAAPRGRRVTDRQLLRLARHKQQLAQRAERLFDHHMERIVEVFKAEGANEMTEHSGSPYPPEDPAREELVRLARKILEPPPARKTNDPDTSGASSPPAGQAEGSTGHQAASDVSSLYALARRLQELEEDDEATSLAARNRALERQRPKS